MMMKNWVAVPPPIFVLFLSLVGKAFFKSFAEQTFFLLPSSHFNSQTDEGGGWKNKAFHSSILSIITFL